MTNVRGTALLLFILTGCRFIAYYDAPCGDGTETSATTDGSVSPSNDGGGDTSSGRDGSTTSSDARPDSAALCGGGVTNASSCTSFQGGDQCPSTSLGCCLCAAAITFCPALWACVEPASNVGACPATRPVPGSSCSDASLKCAYCTSGPEQFSCVNGNWTSFAPRPNGCD